MRTIKIGEKEYILEYTFEAAEHKDCVQNIFNLLSGAYLVKNGSITQDKKEATAAMIDGLAEMVSELPKIVKTSFHAGLLEHHNVSQEESSNLMKQYMKENKLSYKKMLDNIKNYMEEDGFFDLSGLTEMLEELNQTEEEIIKEVKKPQDHKKKSTSTK